MRIAVCVKQAFDEAEIKFDASGKAQLKNAQTKMSTFDKNAVEEALRIRASYGGEVIVFSLGNNESKKALKEALAMGADKAVHILSNNYEKSALTTSKLLSSAIKKYMPFDILLFSEGSSDTYTSLVPGQVASLLGISYIPFTKKIELSNGKLKAVQAMEQKSILVEAPLPAAVSVVSEINQPRYPTLIQIMQATKKPIEELKEEALGSTKTGYSVREVVAQTVERKKIIFEGNPEETARKLIDALRKEGVIKA
jgi:electron transfer flavoprotein beta subunit